MLSQPKAEGNQHTCDAWYTTGLQRCSQRAVALRCWPRKVRLAIHSPSIRSRSLVSLGMRFCPCLNSRLLVHLIFPGMRPWLTDASCLKFGTLHLQIRAFTLALLKHLLQTLLPSSIVRCHRLVVLQRVSAREATSGFVRVAVLHLLLGNRMSHIILHNASGLAPRITRRRFGHGRMRDALTSSKCPRGLLTRSLAKGAFFGWLGIRLHDTTSISE